MLHIAVMMLKERLVWYHWLWYIYKFLLQKWLSAFCKFPETTKNFNWPCPIFIQCGLLQQRSTVKWEITVQPWFVSYKNVG